MTKGETGEMNTNEEMHIRCEGHGQKGMEHERRKYIETGKRNYGGRDTERDSH